MTLAEPEKRMQLTRCIEVVRARQFQLTAHQLLAPAKRSNDASRLSNASTFPAPPPSDSYPSIEGAPTTATRLQPELVEAQVDFAALPASLHEWRRAFADKGAIIWQPLRPFMRSKGYRLFAAGNYPYTTSIKPRPAESIRSPDGYSYHSGFSLKGQVMDRTYRPVGRESLLIGDSHLALSLSGTGHHIRDCTR